MAEPLDLAALEAEIDAALERAALAPSRETPSGAAQDRADGAIAPKTGTDGIRPATGRKSPEKWQGKG